MNRDELYQLVDKWLGEEALPSQAHWDDSKWKAAGELLAWLRKTDEKRA